MIKKATYYTIAILYGLAFPQIFSAVTVMDKEPPQDPTIFTATLKDEWKPAIYSKSQSGLCQFLQKCSPQDANNILLSFIRVSGCFTESFWKNIVSICRENPSIVRKFVIPKEREYVHYACAPFFGSDSAREEGMTSVLKIKQILDCLRKLKGEERSPDFFCERGAYIKAGAPAFKDKLAPLVCSHIASFAYDCHDKPYVPAERSITCFNLESAIATCDSEEFDKVFDEAIAKSTSIEDFLVAVGYGREVGLFDYALQYEFEHAQRVLTKFGLNQVSEEDFK